MFRSVVPIDLDGERGGFDAFSALDDLASRARVALLVEMDHFVHEKYAFRLLLIRYLASRGWTWFGEEIDHRAGRRTDAYLAGGPDDLLDPIDEPDWYTRGILATGPPRPHPAAALAAEQRRFAQTVRDVAPGAHWFGFDVGADDAEYLRLANAAGTYDALGPAMACREALMHQRVDAVLDAQPTAKVALMAGSLHLVKDDRGVEGAGAPSRPGGGLVPSLGHHVAERVGPDRVLAIWLLHGTGISASPWLAPPGALAPAPGTVDAELAGGTTGPVLAVVDRHDRSRRRVTQMHNLAMTCCLADQVDAVVFVPEVSPLRA